MLKKLAVSLVAFLMFPIVSQAEVVMAYRSYVNTWVPGISSLEHTFACVNNTNNCYSFPLGTNKSNGSLAESGWAQRVTGQCHASCAIAMTYPSGSSEGNGVCHQHTNRVLFEAYKVLPSSVNGYWSSKSFWGVTGNKKGPTIGRFQACWQSCGGLSTLVTD